MKMPRFLDHGWDKSMRIVLYVSFFIGIVLLGWNNLPDPNFWIDEAWQFEAAHGISLDAPLLTPTGSFTDVIRQNQIHNGDPGGFTFILYFWSKINSSPFWLRLIPYTFFLISLYFAVKLSSFFIKSKNILAFMPLVLLVISFVFRYGFMLRPYSMELCGISVTLYLMMQFLRSGRNKDQWVLGTVGAFFLTSRYSFFLSFASIVMTIFIMKYRLSFRLFIQHAYGLYGPPIITAILIYFFALQYQIVVPFALLAPFLLHGQSLMGQLKIYYVNFFSFLALPTTTFLVLTLFRYKKHIGKFSFALFLWVTFLEIFFIVGSYLGYVPWHITQRWSLGIQYASTIAVIGLLGYVCTWLSEHVRKINLQIYVVLPTICIYGVILFVTCLKQGDLRDSLYNNLATRGQKIFTERYFVNYHSHTMIRYLFEYGPFNGITRDVYPDHFRFETKEEHDTSSSFDTKNIDIVLLSHDMPDTFLSRFSDRFRDITVYKPSYMLEKLP